MGCRGCQSAGLIARVAIGLGVCGDDEEAAAGWSGFDDQGILTAFGADAQVTRCLEATPPAEGADCLALAKPLGDVAELLEFARRESRERGAPPWWLP